MSGKMATARRPKKDTVGPAPQRLTAQQELFVSALSRNNFNSKAAALEAGVSEKSAARQACLWLDSIKFPQVAIAIERALEKRRNTSEVKADRIIQELARIGFFDPRRILRPDGKGVVALKDMPDDVAAVIKDISVTYGEEQDQETGEFSRLRHIRFTFHDKLSALNQLAGMLGLNGGGAATVINNTTNQLVIKWDDLYRRSTAPTALPAGATLDTGTGPLRPGPTDPSPGTAATGSMASEPPVSGQPASTNVGAESASPSGDAQVDDVEADILRELARTAPKLKSETQPAGTVLPSQKDTPLKVVNSND